ncbi:crotonobetainyl-CoA:carnitine CoA-transferase CaiB-like acyl-CoA transferase [Kineosphaera limosa]|uniref:Putative CaiB/BaiF family protein n=1 Tax=Kineosphaera limosa NBRC 100340 TaxID=1184609 RepID=K6WQ50_9MICO|nr:CoA transferase [Kineosphaera limosa]NYE02806.1 crotonobetainyl-CoA:carnitine CoA-transferase CaiB-like acyl-CoA transferase [Kineosphaera limosa]GAB94237.1 putative CaiB/BaiF family protein [Kineosphaera limosa NBRC 100340]
MQMLTQTASGPLDGLVVVDLSRALAGPHAAMLLGDLGARVIKVEAPAGGDESRRWGPPFVGPDDARESTYFLSCNRNKESVTADLKSPDGVDLLTRLVQAADVLVENFRPGVMDRLGFSHERLLELNSRLVVLSITGFGHDGPQAGRPGYDQIAQGEAGLMGLTGEDPDHLVKVGVPIGDVLAGIYGAYGVLAALQGRERTGRGEVVRTSLLASIVGAHAFQGTRYTVAGEVGAAIGNHHASIAPYGMFRCDDGALLLAIANQDQWVRLCGVLGTDAEQREFADNAARIAHRGRLTARIEEALAGAPVEHWLERFDDAGLPCGKVRSLDEVYDDPQTASQGLVLDVTHESLGQIRIPGPAVRFDSNSRGAHLAPPRLGQHDAPVRRWLDSLEPCHDTGALPEPGATVLGTPVDLTAVPAENVIVHEG